MKKLLLTSLILSLLLPLYGCKKKENNNEPTIGISKIISHPSLDATEKGIIDRLTEKGVKVNYDLQNANGDMNTAASIATKFKSEKVNVAVGIATPIAVALANAMDMQPVIFTAISDPIAADLVETLDKGYKNVTGVVDTVPIREEIIEFRKLYPFKKLGFIYTSSESNAVSMAKTTQEVCKELGVEFIPATITNSSEVKQAAESLIGRVDAFFVVNDNSLVSGVNALASTAKANNIPVFSSDTTSSMDGGIVYALGFDYYKLGLATGDMVIDVLNGKKPSDIPVFAFKDPADYYTIIDLDIAKHLNINIPQEYIDNADMIIKDGKQIKGVK